MPGGETSAPVPGNAGRYSAQQKTPAIAKSLGFFFASTEPVSASQPDRALFNQRPSHRPFAQPARFRDVQHHRRTGHGNSNLQARFPRPEGWGCGYTPTLPQLIAVSASYRSRKSSPSALSFV